MAEPIAWEPVKVLAAKSDDRALDRHEDGTVGVGTGRASTADFRVEFRSGLPKLTAVRVEFFFDPLIAGDKRAAEPAMLGEFSMSAKGVPGSAGDGRLHFSAASADYVRPGNRADMAIDGDPVTAWEIDASAPGARAAVFELRQPIELRADTVLTVHLFPARRATRGFTRFRITVTSRRPPVRELPGPVREALALEPTERTGEQRHSLRACFLGSQKPAPKVRSTK